MNKSRKIFSILGIAIVSIFILLIIITQLPIFKNYLKNEITSSFKNNLNGDLILGDLSGNILTGFEIDSSKIILKNEEIFSTKKINLKYDIFSLLVKTIAFSSIEINEPNLNVKKDKDGKLNISKLFKEIKDSESNWELKIKKFTIVNGFVNYDDEKNLKQFNKINSEFSIENYKDDSKIELLNLSFLSENFELKNIIGEIILKKNESTFNNIKITTSKSDLEFSFSTNGKNIFQDLKNDYKINLQIKNSTLSKNDIEFLLSKEIKIPQKIVINGNLNGTNNLAILENFNLFFGNSELNFGGEIKNIDSDSKIEYKIETKNSEIDILDFSEFIDFKDLQFIKNKKFNIASIIKGNIDNFIINSNLENRNEKIKTELIFDNEKIQGIIESKNLNLNDIFSISNKEFILNSIANFEYNFIDEKLSINSDFSKTIYKNILFSDCVINANYKNNKLHALLNINSSAGEINGDLSFENQFDNILFNGKVSNLNLSDIFENETYSSNINGDINFYANSLSLETDSLSFGLKINNSKFQTENLDNFNLNILIDKKENGENVIDISSPIFDGNISGNFKFNELRNSINEILSEINMSSSEYFLNENKKNISLANFSVSYHFKIKNYEPLNKFLKQNKIYALAEMKGELISKNNYFSASSITNLYGAKIESDTSQILIDKLSLYFDAKNYSPNCYFRKNDSFEFSAKLKSNNLFYNNDAFSHLALEYEMKNGIGRFLFFTEIDSVTKTEIQGSLSSDKNNLIAKLSNIYMRINEFELHNLNPVNINFNKNFAKIDSATLKNNEEKIIFSNLYFDKEAIKGDLLVENLSVRNLSNITFGDVSRFLKGTDGKISASASLYGTLSSPILNLIGKTSNLSLNNQLLGKLNFNIKSDVENMDLNVILSAEKNPNLPLLKINGIYPTEFNKANDSINLKITLNNFPSTLLDPIIPQVENLSGNINGEINYSGTSKNPIGNGFLETKNSKMVLTINGIDYDLAAKLDIENNIVNFTKCTIKNIKSDYEKGKAEISGFAKLKDFIPQTFDLKINGELQVLSNNSKHYNHSFYGSIIASTEKKPINYFSENSFNKLSGDLFITNASVIIPPSNEEVFVYSDQPFQLVIIDDTTKAVIDSLSIPDIAEFLITRMKQQEKLSESKKDTKVNYDLTFNTRGSVLAKIIFNAVTNEELHAYLDGKLSMKTLENKIQLTGNILLGSNSYYNFYKKFDASGSINFTGDATNPELNINAYYEAEHTKADTTQAIKTEKTRVKLSISGNKNEPKIKISLFTLDNNKNEIERYGDVESDAISFLLTSSEGVPGKFREDLTLNDKQNIAQDLGISIGSSIVSNFTSTILSGMLMDFIRNSNIPFVTSAEFRYSSETPVIKLSGEVLDAYWSVGGKIFNDINNANLNVRLPLSAIVGNKNLRNFVFELERKVDPLEVNNQKQAVHGARIYYKIQF